MFFLCDIPKINQLIIICLSAMCNIVHMPCLSRIKGAMHQSKLVAVQTSRVIFTLFSHASLWFIWR